MAEEFFTGKDRCGTCAYRPGTEANQSPLTLLKAKLCLESGELFMCHEDPARIAICKGWVDAFAVRLKAGKLTDDPERRRQARLLSDAIADAEDQVMASQAGEAKRLYDAACARMDSGI